MTLTARFHTAILQLEVCSHARTANPDGPSGGGDHGHVVLLGGDTGHHEYLERWNACTTDHARQQVLDDLQQEVQHLRRGDPARRTPGETEDARQARIVKDTTGWTPADVARSTFAVSERMIRRWRKHAGLDPETGDPRTVKLPAAQRRTEARRLHALGLNPHQIAQRLGEYDMTIRRDLANHDESQAA